MIFIMLPGDLISYGMIKILLATDGDNTGMSTGLIYVLNVINVNL